MREEKKRGRSSVKGGNRISESVVLGVDQANTPARLVVDADGLLDIDKLSTPETITEVPLPASDTAAAPAPEKPSRNPIGAILEALRGPEKKLAQLYQKSSFHRMLQSRFQWYRDYEGESQLRRALDDLYGGKEKTVSGFVKNNIAVSLTAASLLIYLTIQYVSYSPEHYRYRDPETALGQKEKTLVEKKEPHYTQVLNHCVVSDGLRTFYDNTDNQVVRQEIITEVSGFIKVYSASDIKRWHAARDNKWYTTILQIKPILPRVAKFRIQLAEEFSALKKHRDQLKVKLNELAHASNHTLSDINKSIKLRGRLDKLEARLSTAPPPDSLEKLDVQLQRLNSIISGEVAVSSTKISLWAIEMSRHDQATLNTSVRNVVENDVNAAMEQHAAGPPEAELYRVQILTATLRHLGDLVGQLENTPNYYEIQVGKHQHVSNSKLRELFADQDRSRAALLDYSNCLAPVKGAQFKLTLR